MKRKLMAFVMLGLLVLAVGPFALLAGTSVKADLEQIITAGSQALNLTPRNPGAATIPVGVKVEALPEVPAASVSEMASAATEAEVAQHEALRTAAKDAVARDQAGLSITPADKAAIDSYEREEQMDRASRPAPGGTLDENGGATFVSTDTPLRIPPAGTGGAGTDSVRSTITVSGLTAYTLDVEVQIDSLIHTFDGDLDMFLRGPTGVQIELSTDNGSTGDNMIRTRFDDEAGTAITAATAPMTGSYRPEVALSAFDGLDPNGNWMLLIYDDASGDTGIVHAWRLQIATANLSLAHNYATASILSPATTVFDPSVSVPVTARFVNYGTTTEDLDGALPLQ